MIVRSNWHDRPSAVEAIVAFNQGSDPALVAEKYRRMRADLFAFFRARTTSSRSTGSSSSRPTPALRFGSAATCTRKTLAASAPPTIRRSSTSTTSTNQSLPLAQSTWSGAPRGFCSLARSGAFADQRDADGPGLSRRLPSRRDRDDPPAPRHHPGSKPTAAEILAKKANAKGPIAGLIAASASRTQVDLLERLTRVNASGERILKRNTGRFLDPAWGDSKPLIQAIQAYGRTKGEPNTFQVIDFATRIAGIGSLGVRRYVALVAGDGLVSGHRVFDIKEGSEPSFTAFAEATGLAGGGSIVQARRTVDASVGSRTSPRLVSTSLKSTASVIASAS